MAWLLQNEHSGGWWHPQSPQGTTLNDLDLAYRFDDQVEAEQTAERLNAMTIHGGEVVRNDGWYVVED
jgi:uncharacterized membrane protein